MNGLGLDFRDKKKIRLNGEVITDTVADSLLKTKGHTLEEVKNSIASIAKEEVNSLKEDMRFKDNLSVMEIVSPAFAKEAKWNKCDDEIFQFVYIAKTIGGGLMLMISNNQGEYQAIPISSNRLDMLADITEAMSSMWVTDPETKVRWTVYDYINHKMEKMLEKATSVYNKNNAILFGTWAVKDGLPSLMINNCKLMSQQESKEMDNGAGGKVTMYKAHCLYYTESPIQCITNHYDSIAAIPGRIRPMPKIYSNDPNEEAFYHLDLEAILDHDGSHPTWDKFMLRFSPSEGKVIMAYVWSILDAKNNGRQMLYFLDHDGFSGKSILMACITEVLGTRLVAALQKDSLNNQFSMDKIWNKILVVIDDNKNRYILRSEKMHQILGSGYADVEPKGKRSFTHRLRCKVIVNGNVKPVIDPDANHERTRLIIIEPKVTTEMKKEFCVLDEHGNLKLDSFGHEQFIGDQSFEENLKAEFRSFLVECKAAYEELCPTRSSIILPDDMVEKLYTMSDDTYDTLESYVDSYLEFDPKYRINVTDFRDIVTDIISRMYGSSLKPNTSMDDKRKLSYDDVVAHLEKKYKIRKGSARIDGKVMKCYIGVKALPKQRTFIQLQKSSELPDLDEDELGLPKVGT